ncbi:helix-turn-helix domain-containing protein [Paenibacillus validus]|uniref:helix-turn-helix domain-containing protein n=1 Tax=Paenibacillus validus TaxID=44253 RepID=UPI003D28FB74
MSTTKKLADGVMASFPRPLSLDRVLIEEEAIPGAVLSSVHYQRFMTLKTGQRLLLIREWLEEMYPGEFSRGRVAERIMYSYQGLKNVENCTKNPRESTVRALIEVYNVSADIVMSGNGDEMKNGVYIGKAEDMSMFFLSYYEQHGENHHLDDTDYTNVYKDIESTRFKTLQVEFIMRVYEPGDRDLLHDRVIVKTELSPTDTKDMWELIVKNAEILSNRHQSMQALGERLDELEQRLKIHSKRESTQIRGPQDNETMEEAYKSLLDVVKKARMQ